jgi:hypothetical protein
MGALRKCRGVLAIGLAVAFLSGPGWAAPDMTAAFATCTGRMSALVEHHWLMSRNPDAVEAEYRAMGDVLAAVVTPEAGAQAMGWRVAAKVAMRAMLMRADLQGDRAAADRAAVLIGECRRLIGAPGA